MRHKPSECVVELNCIARGMFVDLWKDVIPEDARWSDMPTVAQQCLRVWWPEREGQLSPIVEPSELNPIPDEVIIKTHDGRIVFRWTIADELIARESHAA